MYERVEISMKVHFSIVGQINRPNDTILDMDQIPRVGDIINIPNVSQAETYVRTVVWYISYDEDGSPIDEPFVYVVVGSPRS